METYHEYSARPFLHKNIMQFSTSPDSENFTKINVMVISQCNYDLKEHVLTNHMILYTPVGCYNRLVYGSHGCNYLMDF